jgi:hypothetical protein
VRCWMGERMAAQELLPEKRLLRHPNLAKAVGSDPLAARIAQLQPDCHIFGCAPGTLGFKLPCRTAAASSVNAGIWPSLLA